MLLFFLGSQFSRLLRVTFSVFMFAAILSGCGGGGSSSGTPDTIANPAPEPEVVPAPTTFSVSGAIQIPTGSLADNDVMKLSAVLSPNNNSIVTAQAIINPSTTGGYVSSAAGIYQDNSFSYDADPVDFYAVSLLKDQVITLVNFSAESNSSASAQNTILRLIGSDGVTVVNSSSPTPDSKSMNITTSSDYFIEVRADQGPTLYLLTVSQGVATTNQTLLMAADFVPGEVLVKLKESDTESFSSKSTLTYSQANDRAKTQLELIEGLSHLGGSSKHGMRMKIDLSVPRSVMAHSSVNEQAWPNETQQKWETLTYIESLKARDDVEWAEPNYLRKAFAVSDNPAFSAQWHYPLIEVPAAWSVSTGAGVTVAVIDTGIASTHVDLANNIVPGYDFVSIISIAGDGDGIDSNPEDMGGSFHGSHVAGTVAAVNNTEGGVGVAYDANIMPLRVLGVDGSGADADIAEAILFAAGEPNASNTLPAQSASIINLSLGGAGFSNSLQSAIDTAVAKGVIVIAAAGNENSSTAFYPAAFSNVISVSAVGQTKDLAPYSNFGSTISVAAPGGNMQQDANGDGNVDGVLSTVNANSYAWFEGTSMAAPHVAGVAALMKSVDVGLNASAFKSKLELGQLTDDLGEAGKDDSFGYGLINASKAMDAAGTPIPAFLSINPPSVSFDGLNTSTAISMTKGGSTGTIEIISYSDVDNSDMVDATWLTVTEQSVDGNKLGSYLVTIDRTGLPLNSTYLGTITIVYEKDSVPQPNKTISVLMTVPDPSKVATVGTLFVGLIERSVQEAAEDAINQGEEDVLIEIFDFQAAVENQGTYSYSFNSIPLGDYYVFASTNMDQDGIVSDNGEAQGDYPVVGDPTLITVSDADIAGLNFTVSYLNFVEGQSTEENAKPKVIRMIPGAFLPGSSVNKSQNIQKQN